MSAIHCPREVMPLESSAEVPGEWVCRGADREGLSSELGMGAAWGRESAAGGTLKLANADWKSSNFESRAGNSLLRNDLRDLIRPAKEVA